MKYKNYRNPYSGDNRIYSFNDLYNMSFGEVIKNKKELLGQYRVLGVPREEELQASNNVVHVEAYTRDDGTEVKAHWRSKPGSSSGKNEQENIKEESSNVDKEQKNESETDSIEVKTEKSGESRQEKQKEEQVQTQEKEKEKRLYPDEVAGVKRGEPMSKEDAGGKNVNPNYDSNDEGYRLNCTYCAAVYRARQMGYDLEALPISESDSQEAKLLQKYPYYAYENQDGSNVTRPELYRSNDSNECLKNIESKVGKNEEYIMWYQPKEGTEKLAHVVNVSRNDKNELEFYDSQSGKTYGKEYIYKMNFKKISENKIYYYPQFLFRVDDKVVKPKVLNKIARPSQRVPI